MPAFLRGPRKSGSTSRSARAIPKRIAPACPEKPPPLTLTKYRIDLQFQLMLMVASYLEPS